MKTVQTVRRAPIALTPPSSIEEVTRALATTPASAPPPKVTPVMEYSPKRLRRAMARRVVVDIGEAPKKRRARRSVSANDVKSILAKKSETTRAAALRTYVATGSVPKRPSKKDAVATAAGAPPSTPLSKPRRAPARRKLQAPDGDKPDQMDGRPARS